MNEPMKIIKYINSTNITVEFIKTKAIKNTNYNNFIRGQVQHPICYEESLGYYIECEVGENLYDVLNMSKNKNIDVYKIPKNSNKIKLWFLCEKEYHNDYGGYEMSCNQYASGCRCPYCHSKKIHPKDSFAQWCIDNIDKDFLEKYWSDKNTLDPWSIAPFSNHHKVWIKCQEKYYHGDYLITCNSFSSGSRCSYCHRGATNVHYFDSLGFLYHDISKMIVSDKRNNVTWSDMYDLAPYSCRKFYIICPDCGTPSEYKIAVDKLQSKEYRCICHDSISFCEKFISNLFKELKILYIPQVTSSTFKWCGTKRYDFYLPDYNCIIETHGQQHYKDCPLNNYNYKIQNFNDRYKKHLAKKNGINKYYQINCSDINLDNLRNEIIKNLGNLIYLNNVDWENIYLKSNKSLKLKMRQLIEDEKLGTSELSERLNVAKCTIIRWKKSLGYKINNGKEIELIGIGTFSSYSKASLFLNRSDGYIKHCIRQGLPIIDARKGYEGNIVSYKIID